MLNYRRFRIVALDRRAYAYLFGVRIPVRVAVRCRLAIIKTNRRMGWSVVIACVIVGATLATPAIASTRSDATKVAWYLKGEGDLVLQNVTPPQTIEALTCTPTRTNIVRCKLRTATARRKIVTCDDGRFIIAGYAVNGQWGTPHACKQTPAA